MEIISSTPTTAYTIPTKPNMIGKYKLVPLNCNIFDIKLKNLTQIYQISFKIEPEIEQDSRELLADILKKNQREMRKYLGFYADSGYCIFSFKKPSNKKSLIFENHKDYILILEAHKMKTLKINDALKKGGNLEEEIIRVLNIIMKNKMRNMDYSPLGKDMKYFNLSRNLAGRNSTFKIFEGYKTSIGYFDGYMPKLIIDYCTKIARSQSLWQEILERCDQLMERGRNEDIAFDQAIEEVALGQQCIADYGNKKVYRIAGIEEKMTPMSPFPKNEKKFKTFYDYFLKTYKYKIRDREQPLVYAIQKRRTMKNGKKVVIENKIHLVPEMLRATGMTDNQRADFRLMKEVAQYTKLDPKDRMGYIYEHGEALNAVKKGKVERNAGHDIDIDLYSNEIEGKQLEFPRIQIGGKKTVPLSYKWGGNFQVKGKLLRPVNLNNWAIVYQDFEIGRNQMFKNVITNQFKFISKSLGFRLDKPKKQMKLDFKERNFSKIEKLLQIAAKNKCQIVVFMLNDFTLNRGPAFYKKIKAAAYKYGVATQVMKTNTKAIVKRGQLDNRKISGYVENVLIQIQKKIGAALWKVNDYPYESQLIKSRKDAKKARPCLVGVDVCHMRGMKSVVGISGTINRDFTKTRNNFKIQPRNGAQEIVDYIGQQVVEIVESYSVETGSLPTNLIVYRDGVGEGQIRDLYIREVNSITKSLEQRFPQSRIDVTVILVTKRISERFFLNDGRYVSNPKSGLIVDSGVTRQGFFEWFMVGQNVTQGSATPTKYRVIHNDVEEMSVDYLYNLTYFTTFLFKNWKGPIRVPMVMQNAHTIAYQVSACGIRDIAETLKNSEFFL